MLKKVTSIMICMLISLMANTSNYHIEATSKTVSSQSIEFELKDIQNITLYTTVDGKTQIVDTLDLDNLSSEGYVVRIRTYEGYDQYFEVKSIDKVEDNVLLKIDTDVRNTDGSITKKEISIQYAKTTTNVVDGMTEAKFIETIKNNPDAVVELTRDLDFTGYETQARALISEFRGELNGNGYSIRGLRVPVFDNLNNSTVTNIVISNIHVDRPELYAIFANNITSSTVSNLHIKNSSITANHKFGTGGLTGNISNSTVDEVSLDNVNVAGITSTGALIGNVVEDTTVKNISIKNSSSAGGYSTGGVVGKIFARTVFNLSHSIIQVEYTPISGTDARAGVIGENLGALKISNIIIDPTKGETEYQGKTVLGAGKLKANSAKIYEVTSPDFVSQADGNDIISIQKSDINTTLVTKTLQLDKTKWNLKDISSDNMPTLKSASPESNESSIKDPTIIDGMYLPNYDELKNVEGYDASKNIAYANLSKLSLYLDTENIVEFANQITDTNMLTKQIKEIHPLDENNELVTYVMDNNPDTIKSLMIVFDDETRQTYTLAYNTILNSVATYTIEELNTVYMFKNGVIRSDISLIDTLINEYQTIDYTTDLDPLTRDADPRHYKDWFNDYFRANNPNAILELISNQDELNLTLNNEILINKVQSEIETNNTLNKLVYAYSYFDRFYNFKIGDISIDKLVFFNNENQFEKPITPIALTQELLASSTSQRDENGAVNYYNSKIKSRNANLDVKQFIQNLVDKYTDYTDYNDWFAQTFRGELREVPYKDNTTQTYVKYRAWEKLSDRHHMVLLTLSIPEQEDMYIISMPSQIAFGSLNRYSTYFKSEQDKEVKFDDYAKKIATFYNTLGSLIEGAEDKLNLKSHITYDTSQNFPVIGDQLNGTATDPIIKWIYEPLNKIYNNGWAAFANGTDVYFVSYSVFESWSTFTHETTHNQDGYFLFEGYGRRSGSGAEDYATGGFQQDYHPYQTLPNLSMELGYDSDIAANFSPTRIDSEEEFKSYYDGMYDTLYLLDYLAAEAFLRLTPLEQSRLAVQAEHNSTTTVWSRLTEQDFIDMDLKNMNDIYNNKLALRSGPVTQSKNTYSWDGLNQINWYQPHNTEGVSDGVAHKRMYQEMASIGGYTEGLVAYASGKNPNDVEALRDVMNDPTMNFKKYKQLRFNEVKDNLDNVVAFDYEKVIDAYEEALKSDAAKGTDAARNSLRLALYNSVKRTTNDFTTGTVYDYNSIVEISTAQELIDQISSNNTGYLKLTNDLDFSSIEDNGEVAYALGKFYGVIDGNGFTISGTDKPLIESTKYAMIKNLTIDASNLDILEGSLVKDSNSTILSDITTINADANMNEFNTMAGNHTVIGYNKTETSVVEITTEEELLQINDNPENLKKVYSLKNDIEITSNVSTALIRGEFKGIFRGNGHTISGQRVPMFENLKGEVYDVVLSDVTMGNTSSDHVGVLTGKANGAKISNIEVKNANITGKYRTAAVVGLLENSDISRIKVSDSNVNGSFAYNAVVIGRAISSSISDIYATNSTLITNRTQNGGAVGSLEKGSTVTNAYIDVNVERPSNQGDTRDLNAGAIGSISSSGAYGTVTNLISTSTVSTDVYSVIGEKTATETNAIKTNVHNTYQVPTDGRINNDTIIMYNGEVDKNFLVKTLKLDAKNVWNLEDLNNISFYPEDKQEIQQSENTAPVIILDSVEYNNGDVIKETIGVDEIKNFTDITDLSSNDKEDGKLSVESDFKEFEIIPSVNETITKTIKYTSKDNGTKPTITLYSNNPSSNAIETVVTREIEITNNAPEFTYKGEKVDTKIPTSIKMHESVLNKILASENVELELKKLVMDDILVSDVETELTVDDIRVSYADKVLTYTIEDNNNTVTDNNIITITRNVIVSTDIFTDIDGHWAEEFIREFGEKGYSNGYDDKTFKPNNSITRAEFVKFLNKYFGLVEGSGKVFDDTKGHWAEKEIDIAYTHGVVNGTSPTTFSPNAFITREEAAIMITNFMKVKDENFDKIAKYDDGNQVSSWAKSSVEAALENGYMYGYNETTIAPKNNVTRAETVVILSRIQN